MTDNQESKKWWLEKKRKIPMVDRTILKMLQDFRQTKPPSTIPLESMLAGMKGMKTKLTTEDLKVYLELFWSDVFTVRETDVLLRMNPENFFSIRELLNKNKPFKKYRN